MKLIKIHSRKYSDLFSQVDDEDYAWLNLYQWNVKTWKKDSKVLYARTIPSQGRIPMHRMLFPEHNKIDHIDGNGLNNQRNNLRLVTSVQNQMNIRKRGNNFTSSYKGVYWNKERKKWQVGIRINNKSIFLGRFNSEIEGAKAYDEKAKELFGEYACLNFS